MLYRNQAGQKIGVFAYTASTGAAKTGDAAQITCYESIGFAAADQLDDANPTELDATNMPGWYVFDLTQAETNGEVLIFAPKSSTSGVVLDQIQVVTEASVAQTGDAYAVVNHADYGNSKLVRSTTPANTLTVDASHQALSLTNAVSNDAITAAAIANGAIDAATFAAGAIDAAAIADNAIDAGALANDAITAAKLAADVTTELQSGLATSAELAKVPKSDSNVTWNATALASIQAEATDALNAYDPPTNAEMIARTLVAANYFDPAADTVANVTTVATTTNLTNLPAAAALEATLTAMKGATFSGLTDSLEALRDRGDVAWITATGFATPTNITAGTITTVTNLTNLPAAAALEATLTDMKGAGYSNTTDTLEKIRDAIPAAAPSAADNATAAAAAILGTPANKLATDASGYVKITGTKNTLDDLNDAAAAPSAADIKTELEADGSKLDHLWEMTEDDGGVRRLTANALEQGPTGTGLDAAGVRAAVGLASANLDTQLGDLPTNAELGTALAGADDAVLAAVAALNNLSSAEAQTAATAALNAYDPPTNAEMVARTLVAANYFDPAADVVAHVTLVDTTTTNTDMVDVSGLATSVEITGLNDITVADIIAGITEGSLDLQEILRIILAAVAGKASGGGTATIKFRDQADTLDRITATVDENGNRSAVVVDGS